MIKLVNHGLRDFAASRLWYNLGRLLVEVFVPLLLLKHGLSLVQVCLYFAVSSAAGSLLAYPCARLISRCGQRPAFVVAYTAAIAYQVMLGVVVHHASIITVAALAVALGATNIFSLMTTATHMAENVDVQHKGRENAVIQIATQFAQVIGPFIGTIIALTVGPAWLSPVAAVLVVLGLAQIWGVGGDHGQGEILRFRGVATYRDLVAAFSVQFHADIGMIMWPVYLAVVTPTYRSIGLIATFAGLVTVLALWWYGRRIDNGKIRRVMIEALAILSGFSLLRPLSTHYAWLSVMTAGYNLIFACFWITWTSIYFHNARRHRGLSYVMVMETVGSAANLVIWLSFAGALVMGAGPAGAFRVAFLTGAVASWGCLLLRR